MSYILDALKRANLERERSAVPGLNSMAALPATGDRQIQKRFVVATAILGAVCVGCAVAYVLITRPAAPSPSDHADTRPLPAPAISAPAPDAQQSPEANYPKPVVLPEPVKSAAAAIPPATAAAPSANEAPTANAQPTQAAARVMALSELPSNLRQQIPALTISGIIYAGSKAQRMLILNGQLVQEGDKAGADLVLEQIKPKSAVLNFKGTRFELQGQ